jgi:hypothetical protein
MLEKFFILIASCSEQKHIIHSPVFRLLELFIIAQLRENTFLQNRHSKFSENFF